jgi:hypothetical protein
MKKIEIYIEGKRERQRQTMKYQQAMLVRGILHIEEGTASPTSITEMQRE